jgi:hypothetical protein
MNYNEFINIMNTTLKNGAKKLLPHNLYEGIKWRLGITLRPPEIFGYRMRRELGKKHGFNVFIETGTYYGETLWAVKNVFREIHSVELNEPLYEKAKIRFASVQNVHLHLGDSTVVLPQILTNIHEPALIYLDGHWCGDHTAKGETNTPIQKELGDVLNHPYKHGIVIDDARLFNGTEDYPTLEEVREFVQKIRPEVAVNVVNDKIVII